MIRRIGYWPLLAAVAFIALALRLVGLDWDRGLYLHPDERFVVWVTTDLRWPESIGQYFNSSTSPLNPYNTQHDSFVYGTFPSFLVKAIAGMFGMDNYSQLYLVGRATNAVFDTGTVVLTALLAQRFFNRQAGLIAGVLLAFTPLFLQSAHFFTVDTISVFFAIAAFACVVRSWDRNSIGWMALAGVMVGLASASKPNYLIALAFLVLPTLELVRRRGWRSLIPRLEESVYPAVPATLAGGFLAFWSFRFAQPYAFSGLQWWNISLNQQWLDDLAFWRAVQTGLVDMKPSIQWIERTPVVYILQNMVLWGMGVALGITALLALGVATWKLVRHRQWPSWWWLGIVGWCIGSIALYGTGIAQNQRYLMHIYPFLIILVAGFLVELHGRLSKKWVGQLLATLVVVYTVVFGLAFNSLYVRPITRIEASEWIYENVPAGSMLSNEYWDDALPMPLPGQDRAAYPGMTLDLYADEAANNSKVVTLVGQLSQVDYIVLSSNRVIDSVVRQPERYPVAVRFYEMLLDGELGFEPVAHFHQGPEIFGIMWDDRSAEESLTVYEHPEVRIFVKTDAYNAQYVHDELNAAWGYGGYHYIPGDPLPQQMLMSEADMATQQEEGAWEDQVGSGWVQDHPLVSWWVVMTVMGLAAWPLTWRAFRNLPDMGWMLARSIGVIGMAAIMVALVSWGGLAFDRRSVVISILLLAAIGFMTQRCVWDEFRYKVRHRWRHVLAGEMLFTGVFLVMAMIRSWQGVLPDHNLVQLTGVMRSVSLPPMDPWLSEGLMHTHWAGVLPWAMVGRVASLAPVVALNLAVIGVISLIAGVTWSVVTAQSRSWIGMMVALVVVFGSSFAFRAGIAPVAMSDSASLGGLTAILMIVSLIHALMSAPRQRWTRLFLTAVIAGGIAVGAGWGFLVMVMVTGVGLAINEWSGRSAGKPWWPVVRRYVLTLVGIVGAGLVIWYPAYAAHTATSRNLRAPVMWTLTVLRDELGMVLLLAAISCVAVGAVSVLALLMDEGPPGIVVSGVAIAVVIGLLVFAWRLDSALVLLLLVSMLTVAAGWYWRDTMGLLWTSALVLIACLLLAIVQTRPFHLAPGGDSSALHLVPLAWTLLVVGLGLGIGQAVRHFTAKSMVPAVFVISMVAVMLVIPTADQIRLADRERTALANPRVIAPEGELQAATWLQDHAEGMPVILTGDGPGAVTQGNVSAMTGFPGVLGNEEFGRITRPGWNRLVEQRQSDVATIYTGMRDWAMVSPLIERYAIRYIVVGNEERARFGTIDESFDSAVDAGRLQKVFDSGDTTVYQVVSASPDAGE